MESLFGLEVLLAVLILILYMLSAQWLENKACEYFHETNIAIGLGALCGVGVYMFTGGEKVVFSTGIFFYFVLPPIIFAAGYNLKSRLFFVNLGFISLYGFLGTFLSFVTIGALGVFFNANGALSETDSLSTKEILLLSCVLSATDTVAAISVVKETKYPRLNSILFGEGVINDAVSIVLYRTVEGMGDEFGLWEGVMLVISFVYTTCLSIFIGFGSGLATAWIIKNTKELKEHPERETTLIILGGYVSYIVSELLGLSGIMTIFCCGIALSHYAWFTLSKESQQGTSLVFTVLSQGAEAFTFTYLGMTITTIDWEDWNILLLVCMFVAMALGRAASILISSALVYLIQCGHFGLDTKNICVAWFSGLIRGAIAFALVLQVESEHQNVLISTTLGIAIVTTVGLSNLMGPYTRFVGLEAKPSQEIYFELMSQTANTDDSIYSQQLEEIGLSWFHMKWQKFDEKYLKPRFGGEEKAPLEKSVWDKLWAEDEVEINKLG
mmetsp:Transcript_1646/g.2673  ORF Transcript_1646/g.2673 Transcript_1646/m.2673 type:complete len:497 (-) Transcript_1646:19-1509(-)